MTIQELANEAGVTTRTIRYYVEQGVLPPPDRGRPAEYTGEHVHLLDLIRQLKEQFLPLEEIRDMMQRLSTEQLQEIIAAAPHKKKETQNLSSAADYIAGVLQAGSTRQQMKEAAPPRTLARAAATQAITTASTPLAHPAPSHARQALATREDNTAYIDQPATWQRVTLAQGIELHYVLSGDAHHTETVARLLDAARHILDEGPGKDTEEIR
ncbi:MAG TPA: helix-turn-helix domain-containing protein [Chloroflexia bacterium]|nr:helix-turn-helix domain-containing protein [Chloroflexia bacterium]